jgi:hypothetical protein
MSASFLIEILLPKETGESELVSQEWFETFLKELTDRFGGAASFLRSQGRGLWRDGRQTEHDAVVIEIMRERLARDYWRSLRERLERELVQQEIVVRAQKSSGYRMSAQGGLMDAMMLLRTFAASTTIIAAALVAANWNARMIVAGFAVFILASLAWMADGWLEGKASLVIQNAILLLINILGVWRWFPKAEKETN